MKGHFGDIDSLVDTVQQQLSNHQPQPSLLHGDLWSGNCARSGPDGPPPISAGLLLGRSRSDLAMLPLHRNNRRKSTMAINPFRRCRPVFSSGGQFQLYTLLNRAILFGGQRT